MKLFKIKKVSKYVVSALIAGVLLSLAVFPTLNMQASGPEFNNRPGDWELFTGATVPTTDPNWYDPVIVNPGNVVQGRIYYHNGILDSVAEDTRIHVTLPEVLTVTQPTIYASIWADNAGLTTDTVIHDEVNGPPGLTLDIDRDVMLDYVPGTVEWFPDVETRGLEAPMHLPFGQEGAELFTPDGLAIGDVAGCWDHAGWIYFKFTTSPVAPNDIAIEKTVSNVTALTPYVKSVNAGQGERVSFKLDVAAVGYAAQPIVIVRDELPMGLIPVEGSARLIKLGATTPIPLMPLLGAGVDVGPMVGGEIDTIIFEAVTNQIIPVAATLINNAFVDSSGLIRQSSAAVNLIPGVVNLQFAKSAFNLTQNVDATTTVANPGDAIRYTLVTTNTGNLPATYTVADGVSDILEYADIAVVSDGGSVITNTAPNPAAFDGMQVVYPETIILPGGTLIRTFDIVVKPSLPLNAESGSHFNFQLENIYGNTVIINLPRPRPEIFLDKTVRNVTTNEQNFVKADTANAGDLIEYKIYFKNTGVVSVDHVKISDVLPANVVLDPNSAAILAFNGVERSIPEKLTDGIVINNFTPGGEAYVRFKAVISGQVAGNEVLRNVAFLDFADQRLSSDARTVILQKFVQASAPLPRTGSADALLFSGILAMIGSGTYVFAIARARS